MGSAANILNSLVPISMFNRGQASRIFDRLRTESHLIVLKNNQPSAVILSPEEYGRMAEIEEDYFLLMEAMDRLEKNKGKPVLSEEEVLAELGLTEADIEAAEDEDIE